MIYQNEVQELNKDLTSGNKITINIKNKDLAVLTV